MLNRLIAAGFAATSSAARAPSRSSLGEDLDGVFDVQPDTCGQITPRQIQRVAFSGLYSDFASAGAAGLAKTSRPVGSRILRHCAGVTPMRLLKARWNAASD